MKKLFFILLLFLSVVIDGPAWSTLTVCDPARWDYTGNGSSVNFAYSCRIIDDDHLTVIKVDSAGAAATLVLGTDYTVTGVGAAAGGNVVFTTAPLATDKVVILRNQPAEQSSDYILGEGFPSERVERDLDKLAMLAQQHREVLARALKFRQKSTKKDICVEDPTGGEFVRWNTGATCLESVAGTLAATDNFTQSGAGAVTRTETSKLGDIINARDFGVTCDGATDDTAAFALARAEALSRKAILNIQEGTCLIDGDLITGAAGLTILGQGRTATIIKKRVVNSPAKPVLDITSSSDLIIADLTIDGNKTASEEGGAFNNNTNSGVRCVNCSNITLSNIRIQKTPGWALSFRPTNNSQKNVYLDDVQTDDTARVDFGGNGTANVQINKLISANFHDTSAEGWAVDMGAKSGFRLENSELQGTAVMPAIGMTLRGGSDAKVARNFIKLIREGNAAAIELGEDQTKTSILDNTIEVTPANAAKNQGVIFAVQANTYSDFIIAGNAITNRGGDALAAHIGTDEGDIQNISISANIFKSSNAGYTGSYVEFNAGAANRIAIDNNIFDGSNLTGGPNFIDVGGLNSTITSNIFMGGSGAETGILAQAGADNWTICANVFKNVNTQTNFTTATNIVECNTTTPSTGVTYAVKSADQTLTQSSTTLQNVTNLSFTATANKSYEVELKPLLNAAGTAADWKLGWTLPAGATMSWGGHGQTGVQRDGYWTPSNTIGTPFKLLIASDTMVFASDAATLGVVISAIVQIAGTGGTVQFQAAQNVADASDNKILKNSLLKYKELQ